jgi:ubiquinone/menaquinone biosynthesis C-methylase UbiE
MLSLKRRQDPHALAVAMSGVRMGDRLVQIGCAHAGRLAAVAAPVGLSGRAVAVVPDDASAARARTGAEQAGVLIEVMTTPLTRLPLENDAFDVAIIDDTGGLLTALGANNRVGLIHEVSRVLRPGGRVVVIGAGERGGLGALFSRAAHGAKFDPIPLLEADRFRAARRLAEREGLAFVEAIKPRN